MRRIAVFNSVSLDGYFSGKEGDLSWAYRPDPEFDAFTEENAGGGGVLLFGRVTYELMAAYWPTPQAMENDPRVAENINAAQKFVVSRTLNSPAWRNTTLLKGDLVTEVRALKQAPGEDITILGSGSIVAQLTQAGLIDEYQIVVVPVVLGTGETMFAGVQQPLQLALLDTRVFSNGNVWLRYEPAGRGVA